jgi:cellulose synthase/poly-beta-1,6-N-acetylglucosamine synthase-like glycosyltransferase
MALFEWIFWISAACVLYTYIVYPLALALAARLRPAPPVAWRPGPAVPVSVVLAAYNEESHIAARVRELARLVAAHPGGGEVIVVCDGSTDRTSQIAETAASEKEVAEGTMAPVRIFTLSTNVGKAAALSVGCAAASHPLLVLGDARQTWASDAVDRLAENFADPSIAAVSGDLVLESPSGVMAGFGLYWRFEKWLRRTESEFKSLVSVTGSISAVRRELFCSIPPGTILDDVYWPLALVMTGHRVVHDARAIAFDRLPLRVRDEFGRKVRTLCGNFQVFAQMPSSILPWRNPLWWQFISHRVLRLLVPWAMLGLLASTLVLDGPGYRLALCTQAVFYLLAALGSNRAIAARLPLASAASAILILNTAAWIAFWFWISGRADRCWGKLSHRVVVPGHAVPEPAALGAER